MSNATWLSEIPQLDRKQLLEIRKTLDGAYRDFSREYGDTIESLFDPLLSFLIWFEKLLLSSPWWLIIGILVGLAYVASRSWKLSASVGIAFFVIGFFGMWDNTMRTMSIILVSTMLAIASGYPPGSLWLSRKKPEPSLPPYLT